VSTPVKLEVHDPYEDAFRHVLAHRTMLLAIVKAVLRDPHQVEDTFSDVTLEIVRCWQSFDQSRPFGPWARGLARRVALANLRKAGREITSLDAEVLELLGTEIEQKGGESLWERYKTQLGECLGRLSSNARRLVRARYFEGRSYAEMAALENKSVGALYVAFTRIHQSLARCLKRQPPAA
jgi:RNA polymerase sigma-70 factor (ECF subfamily)